jgi:hemerythrin-like domain-containing protein
MKRGLHEAFLTDHRVLTRGLQQIREALEQGAVSEASALARDLDSRVGPHMEFEETVLYPRLVQPLGKAFVRQLYREHSEGREAIRQLIVLTGGSDSLATAQRKALIAHMDAILEHVLSCGTLLSHLDCLPQTEQRSMLERLEALSGQGHKWTDLPARQVPV